MAAKGPSTLTARDIDLAMRLMRLASEDDSTFESIPDDATLILLPSGDGELVMRNIGLATSRASMGDVTYVRRIGSPIGVNPSGLERLPHVLRWSATPTAAGSFAIHFHVVTGSEVFDFSGGVRFPTRVPVGNHIELLVDPNRLEVVGYAVPESFGARLFSTSPSTPARDDVYATAAARSWSASIADFTRDLLVAA